MLKKTVLISLFIISSLLFVSCSKDKPTSDVPDEVIELQTSLEQFQGFIEIAKNFNDIKEQMQNVEDTETE